MPYRWSPWPKQSEHGYKSMSTKGEKDNDDTEIPRELPLSLSPKPSLLARRGWLFPWVMCIFLSAALIIVTSDHRHAHHQSSYEMGFDTDLGMLASEKLRCWLIRDVQHLRILLCVSLKSSSMEVSRLMQMELGFSPTIPKNQSTLGRRALKLTQIGTECRTMVNTLALRLDCLTS